MSRNSHSFSAQNVTVTIKRTGNNFKRQEATVIVMLYNSGGFLSTGNGRTEGASDIPAWKNSDKTDVPQQVFAGQAQ